MLKVTSVVLHAATMKIVSDINNLKDEISTLLNEGSRIVLVPTMGNLHEAHLTLVAKGLSVGLDCKVVATIFVNPLQFTSKNPGNNDLEKYPRTLENDTCKLEGAGCHLLFAPKTVQEVLPKYPVDTNVNVGQIGKILEGEFRPGFFEGVATIVTILINLCRPSAIVFGEKDWQQLQVIRQFVKDLHFDVEIISVPTGREASGLAMSSRNNYLSLEEKDTASHIYKVLSTVAQEVRSGNRDFGRLETSGTEQLTAAGFAVEYLAIRRPDLSTPSSDDVGCPLVVLVAAFLNSTRLIDNLVIPF